MSSKVTNLLIRIIGIVISAILLIQPWLIKVESIDPFLISGWMQIVAASIAIFAASLLLAFYRPIKAYFSLTNILFLCFIAIGISLYFTHYTACLRASMIAVGLLACIGSLRLFRKDIDNFSISGMLSLSGFFMAIYAIGQYLGHDFLVWESKYNVVGTLTNPNFLGIFLCLTSCITFGLVSELYTKSIKDSLIFLSFLILQLIALLIVNKSGINLILAVMVIFWFWSKWFNISGKIARISPIFVGLILAFILLLTQWKIYEETTRYPWKEITSVSNSTKPFVSRVILWQMGFSIFKEHYKTGSGIGSTPFIMPLKRPPTGSTLGLKIYNDDPHSFVVSALAETGFLGLWGICSILVAIFGAFTRKNTRFETLETTSSTETIDESRKEISFPWYPILVTVIIVYLSVQSGYIPQNKLPIVISLLIIFFGFCTSFLNNSYIASKNDYFYIGRSTLTAIFAFTFYSFFNNTLSILPLVGTIILIISLHFSCCQPDVKFKSRKTFISFLFIFLPFVYCIMTCHFQYLHQLEEAYLAEGLSNYNEGKFESAERSFLSAIETNHQCLRAYHALALTLEAQGKIEEAQDVLTQLDTMVPNIFNAKYEIARILFDHKKIREAHIYAVKNLEWASDPASFELLGKIFWMENRKDKAEQTFKEGLVNVPSNVKDRYAADRIRLWLAHLTLEKNDLKNSKSYLNAITTDIAEEIDVLYMKGIILTKEKKNRDALRIFEELLKKYPENPIILNATGYLLLTSSRNLDRAQVLLEKAFELLKNNNQASNLSDYLMVANSLGKLYQKQNKLSRALELMKLAYDETPEEQKNLKASRLEDLNALKKAIEGNK